ncbi:glycine zipper 2TM domain-containing protein [Sphingosinicella sp. CPCC 101087]|uniref:glycine zipper 2TM domain-containing protein n=1 Tax=Sphingosinicella sp. CPCC 101087 TaxID=2497754 RepID=UPI001FB0784D|nr:glycine zipper 2TM domain-containing protein [Sphingosinicella sp. CPCC 101087]
MKTRLFVMALATASILATPAFGQSRAEEDRWRAAQQRFDQERAIYDRERERYEEAVRRDESYRASYNDYDYDAARDYREDPRYQERPMGAEDHVYRGSDGRYYCRRSDGTTGLVVGAGAGALLGRAIDGGRSRATGTIFGGVLGALLGRTVEQNADVRCR